MLDYDTRMGILSQSVQWERDQLFLWNRISPEGYPPTSRSCTEHFPLPPATCSYNLRIAKTKIVTMNRKETCILLLKKGWFPDGYVNLKERGEKIRGVCSDGPEIGCFPLRLSISKQFLYVSLRLGQSQVFFLYSLQVWHSISAIEGHKWHHGSKGEPENGRYKFGG